MLFEIMEALNCTAKICHNEKTINEVGVLQRPSFLSGVEATQKT